MDVKTVPAKSKLTTTRSPAVVAAPKATDSVRLAADLALACTKLAGVGGGEFAETLTEADPDLPSDVAVIVAVPAPVAVTRPLVSTVATAVSLVDHVTMRSVSTLPFASLVVAVNCCVPPTMSDAADGETVTVATESGGGATFNGLNAAATIAHPEPAVAVAAYDPPAPVVSSSSRLLCSVSRAV